jgi:hypothetical protein
MPDRFAFLSLSARLSTALPNAHESSVFYNSATVALAAMPGHHDLDFAEPKTCTSQVLYSRV